MVLLWGVLGSAIAEPGAEPTPEGPTADQLEQAEEAYRSGESSFNEGNYEAAIIAFRRSLNLSRKSELHFNLAYCMELLGRLNEAHDELQQYKDVAPLALHPTLDKRLAAIQARIDAAARPISTAVLTPAPSVLAAPQRVRLNATDWVFVGSGVAVGSLSLAGVGLTYSAAAKDLAQNNRPAYKFDRALNVTSWLGTTVGAGLMITGVVRASATTVSFDGNEVTLSHTF